MSRTARTILIYLAVIFLVVMAVNVFVNQSNEPTELSLNEFQYLLREGDTFNIIYQVQSINEDSVVLLKGDVIITLYIDEIKYD